MKLIVGLVAIVLFVLASITAKIGIACYDFIRKYITVRHNFECDPFHMPIALWIFAFIKL